MGVKGLWTLLAPYCERKPLFELGGQTVAVDLSGWVCDSQNVTEYHAQPRLYLRNLFFRTCYLLLAGVTPVFVLEGEAPSMKADTMAARNLLQFRGAKPRAQTTTAKAPDAKRKRFRTVLTQCENLLRSMGLQCVKGHGEAEAMCAHLNAAGMVSAIISQDSDCFAYGGLRVYRNFSVSNAGCSSANSGSVDIYDIAKVQETLDMGRNKIVALALLLGCDYNGSGVEGVGYASAVSFLSQHSDKDIINRLVSWISEAEAFETMERRADDPTRCSGCGHGGHARTHARQGCPACRTPKGCHQAYREKRLHIKTELTIRKKALQGSNKFPDPQLMEEFLVNKETTPENFNTNWSRPDLIQFTKLMAKWLDWTEAYCVEKFLPLLTRWQLSSSSRHLSDLCLRPARINKKRNPKGVACYEVVWEDPGGLYEGLISDDQYEDEAALQELWTTVERQDLLETAFPEIVEAFKISKLKPKKTKKAKKTSDKHTTDNAEAVAETKPKKNPRKKNIASIIADLNDSLKNISITGLRENISSSDAVAEKTLEKIGKRKGVSLEVSFKTKSRKYKKKDKHDSKQKRLSSFVRQKSTQFNVNSSLKDLSNININVIRNESSVNPLLLKKKHLFTNLNTTADFLKNISSDTIDDEISQDDISGIIESILTRKIDIDFDACFQNENELPLRFNDSSTPKNKLSNAFQYNSTPKSKTKRRVSYFFGLDNDDDAFERSLDLKHVPDEKSSSHEDENETIEYDLPDYIMQSTLNNSIDNIILTVEERLFGVKSVTTDLGNGNNLARSNPLDSDEYRIIVEEKSRPLTMEEKLFGAHTEHCEDVSFKENCPSPVRDSSMDLSLVYTPLAERIKKLTGPLL